MRQVRIFSAFGLILLIISLLACHSSQYPTPIFPDRVLTQNPKSELPGLPTETPKRLPESFHNHETTTVRKFRDAPDLDLFQLTKELVPEVSDIPNTVEDRNEVKLGDTKPFWLINLSQTKTNQRVFTLHLITEHAHWYVQDGLDIKSSDLSRAANNFEKTIYPTITQIFGKEWIPGVDNDPRLNILNAELSGISGYFNDADEYPSVVRPLSNQSEIIYINALDIAPGSIEFDLVLAHELQHIIHWNADRSEDTWINEGLSELASNIALGSTSSIQRFVDGPPVSLTNWSTSALDSLNHYGAASLFMHFLTEHYGGRADLRALLSQPEDGIHGISEYIQQSGYDSRFDNVFKEWSAANILDKHIEAGDEIRGYRDLEIEASVTESINGFNRNQSTMPQYAVEYTELKSITEPFNLSFEGQTTARLLPTRVDFPGCWWSNSGDSIDSTLSFHIAVPDSPNDFVEYEVWFEIEEHWDYLYIEISADDKVSWQIIETLHTVSENPFGNGFGPAYTGESAGWLTDRIDLARFSGKDIWIRFQYVTDAAISSAGACFKDLPIPKAGINRSGGWESQGFVFTDNIVRQNFQVQLLTSGDKPQVRQLPLDSNNSGTWTVQHPTDGQKLIVSVGSLAEKTRELASYSLSLTPTR